MTTVVAPPSNSAQANAAQPPAEVARARIAVLIASYQVDVVVPTKFTIETFIDDLLVVLAAAIDDDTVDFTPSTGQWSLGRPGEPAMPRWRTLADHDVVDGAVLMLSVVESAEVFTPVVEDITDALALINEREFAEFDARAAAVVGLAVLGAGATAVAALLSWSWTRTGSVWWCALPALLLGMICLGAAVRSRGGEGAARICLGLSLAALPLLFAGAAMLVPPAYGEPGPFSAANVAAGAVVAAVAAAAMIRLTGLGIATLMAVTVLGISLTAAALPMTYSDLHMRQVSSGAVFVGLILLTLAPRLAVVIARIRPPDLPDPGNEVAPSTLTGIFDAESGGDGEQDQAEDSERADQADRGIESRARLAVTSLRGLIAAISTVLAVGSVITAAVSPGGIREIIMAGAVAVLLVMRSRWYPDLVQAIALVSAAAVTVIGVGWVLVGAYQTAPARLVVVAVIAVAAMAGCVAAVRLPGKRLSPPTRRVIDLIEYAHILVVPIIAFWIMGIYTAMRGI
ncbi:type VII secretion integral membrane protein EccD [Nocardia cyriacigeorgica]|uniref:Type VII secretion integral membrane protein EccD n=1 Tax=Nocardia cyriacigeorgica TaxID=135487 RepID=A0ABX0CCL4_9NOCA|nr:type VII secretion integral membrane protein EccD [Nocardia cyriacigeorgica]NEW51113.1 type VII secretion integral membrane protein EccD [Nocardia cyriacigeorgica]NEW54304.1 type VII secretion integral membrane protein EccD [Nocardia cyriacigeorgica]